MKQLKIGTSILLGGLLLSSCAVTPKVHERESTAFDGNDENAGIIQFLEDGSLEITPHKRDEYNGYVALYGTMFVPNVQNDYGIFPLPNGNYSMSKEAIEKLLQMKRFGEYQDSLKKRTNA